MQPGISTPLPYKKRLTRIEGHRGAGYLAAENTLEAFQKGADLDLDGVELDVTHYIILTHNLQVFVSQDGFPVVVHGTDDFLVEFQDSTKNSKDLQHAINL